MTFGSIFFGTVRILPTQKDAASNLGRFKVWFGIIERQAIHRCSFGSVHELNAKIRAFIDGWNDRSHPFVWTKTADQLLAKAKRPTTIDSGH